MLHISLPNQPVPDALVKSLENARKALSAAAPAQFLARQEEHDKIVESIKAHVESVGSTTVAVPRERESDLEAFIEEQKQALYAPPAAPDAPAAVDLFSAEEA